MLLLISYSHLPSSVVGDCGPSLCFSWSHIHISHPLLLLTMAHHYASLDLIFTSPILCCWWLWPIIMLLLISYSHLPSSVVVDCGPSLCFSWSHIHISHPLLLVTVAHHYASLDLIFTSHILCCWWLWPIIMLLLISYSHLPSSVVGDCGPSLCFSWSHIHISHALLLVTVAHHYASFDLIFTSPILCWWLWPIIMLLLISYSHLPSSVVVNCGPSLCFFWSHIHISHPLLLVTVAHHYASLDLIFTSHMLCCWWLWPIIMLLLISYSHLPSSVVGDCGPSLCFFWSHIHISHPLLLVTVAHHHASLDLIFTSHILCCWWLWPIIMLLLISYSHLPSSVVGDCGPSLWFSWSHIHISHPLLLVTVAHHYASLDLIFTSPILCCWWLWPIIMLLLISYSHLPSSVVGICGPSLWFSWSPIHISHPLLLLTVAHHYASLDLIFTSPILCCWWLWPIIVLLLISYSHLPSSVVGDCGPSLCFSWSHIHISHPLLVTVAHHYASLDLIFTSPILCCWWLWPIIVVLLISYSHLPSSVVGDCGPSLCFSWSHIHISHPLLLVTVAHHYASFDLIFTSPILCCWWLWPIIMLLLISYSHLPSSVVVDYGPSLCFSWSHIHISHLLLLVTVAHHCASFDLIFTSPILCCWWLWPIIMLLLISYSHLPSSVVGDCGPSLWFSWSHIHISHPLLLVTVAHHYASLDLIFTSPILCCWWLWPIIMLLLISYSHLPSSVVGDCGPSLCFSWSHIHISHPLLLVSVAHHCGSLDLIFTSSILCCCWLWPIIMLLLISYSHLPSSVVVDCGPSSCFSWSHIHISHPLLLVTVAHHYASLDLIFTSPILCCWWLWPIIVLLLISYSHLPSSVVGDCGPSLCFSWSHIHISHPLLLVTVAHHCASLDLIFTSPILCSWWLWPIIMLLLISYSHLPSSVVGDCGPSLCFFWSHIHISHPLLLLTMAHHCASLDLIFTSPILCCC